MGKFSYIPDNIRIGNMEFRRAKSLLNVKYFEIVKWQDNPLYRQENSERYKYDEDRKMYKDLKYESTWIDPGCFKHPESCFTIAVFEDDDHNEMSELRFCDDRPLELDETEFARFMKIVRLADKELKEMWQQYDPYTEDVPDTDDLKLTEKDL